MVEPIKELRKICYKDSGKKRPWYMELFTMKVSIYVTKLFLCTSIHADQVTMLMVLLVLLGSGMVAFGSIWAVFFGITLIHFTVVLDNVNGEVARYRKEGSLMGSFLEEFYHTISMPFIFFSLGYWIFLNTGIKIALIFGFLCSVFASPIVLTSIKTAVVKKGIDRLESKNGMLPKKYALLKEEISIKGGSTETGKRLYSAYDIIKELWGFPFSVVHIHLIVIFELLNHYLSFMQPYLLPLVYIIAYGTASVIKQFLSFIVHYKGKTVFHYYNALFGKRQ
ncbi:CDP-alcohol phosphatidyltransferase family protein [Candidatus Woesearchaeota archaeon]|nr:CDP-alcohol phosphatidyltransferase family protein [Candidatus Woesearchaeota archaeon]